MSFTAAAESFAYLAACLISAALAFLASFFCALASFLAFLVAEASALVSSASVDLATLAALASAADLSAATLTDDFLADFFCFSPRRLQAWELSLNELRRWRHVVVDLRKEVVLCMPRFLDERRGGDGGYESGG